MSPATKISRVLVGVDFDDASASALKMSGVLASAWDAEITVFHAATQEVPAYFTAAQIDVLEAEREQARAGTADQLRLFAEQHVARAVRVVVGAAVAVGHRAAGRVDTRRNHTSLDSVGMSR